MKQLDKPLIQSIVIFLIVAALLFFIQIIIGVAAYKLQAEENAQNAIIIKELRAINESLNVPLEYNFEVIN